MSVQNDKTLEAYQKTAINYLNNSKIVASIYKKEIAKSKIVLHKFLKDTFNGIPIGSKVLEVGSADGEIAKYISKLGYNVTASDVADDFLKAIKDNGLKPIKFNLLKDNFKDKYKVIVCWKVFVHFTKEDSLLALKRSYNALEDNGLFVLSIINKDCKNIDNEWIDFPGEYHIGANRYFNYFSKDEFDEIINKTKFKIINFKDTITENGIKWLVYVLEK